MSISPICTQIVIPKMDWLVSLENKETLDMALTINSLNYMNQAQFLNLNCAISIFFIVIICEVCLLDYQNF